MALLIKEFNSFGERKPSRDRQRAGFFIPLFNTLVSKYHQKSEAMSKLLIFGLRSLALSALTAVGASAADSLAAEAVAILRTNCSQCHTKAMSMSGLDLSSRESVLRGGSRGPALVAGK